MIEIYPIGGYSKVEGNRYGDQKYLDQFEKKFKKLLLQSYTIL